MSRYLLLLTLALVVAAAPRGLAAEEVEQDEAKALFRQGVDRFDDGDYHNAAVSFRRAYELSPTWKLQYNIGQCEAALKRYGLALDAFERYLAGGGDEIPADRHDEVLAEVRRLREMVGSLVVTGDDGVAVFVDGVLRGTTPLDAGIRVTAGADHLVRLEVEDGEALLEREVFVGGGQAVTIDASREDGDVLPAPVAGPGEEEPAGEGLDPVIFWTAAGATVAFGATTLALNFVAEARWDDANAAPADEAVRDKGEAAQAAGVTFLVLTGAAAVTTGVLAAFTDFGREEPAGDDIALAPWADGQGGGLLLKGRF